MKLQPAEIAVLALQLVRLGTEVVQALDVDADEVPEEYRAELGAIRDRELERTRELSELPTAASQEPEAGPPVPDPGGVAGE